MANEPKLTPVEVPRREGVNVAGTLRAWRRNVGDRVVANETLAELQFDGGAVDLPSPGSGVLARIDCAVGGSVVPGQTIALLEVGPHGTRVIPVRGEAISAAEPPTAASPARAPSSSTPQVARSHAGDPAQGRTMSRKLAGFGTTIFTEMTALANQYGAINLAQGFPDFDGPQFVKDAALAAIQKGLGQYAPMAGVRALQEALAAKYERHYGLRYLPGDEVTITAGATEAIFASINGLCDVGDEVILFEPYYDSYRASVCMAGAIPRVVTLHTPDWRFDPDELRRAFSERTRAIVLNTPHNPTGKVFAKEELQLIASLCVEHDVVCISDEVYEHLVYEGQHLPMASLPGMAARTITISSIGKTFSLTGWKIGWAMAPAVLTRAIRAAHQFITFAVATPLQHGAIAAIDAPESFYSELLTEYRARRDQLAAGLHKAGLGVRMPQGSYFICADIRVLGHFDDVRFCKDLITKVGVAAIPPSVFYDRSTEGKTYVRFAFCKKTETLNAAVERLGKLSA